MALNANERNSVYMTDGTKAKMTVSEVLTFTETDSIGAAATHTGSVQLPANAEITDIRVLSTVLWNDTGTVTMKVGDGTDDDGFFTGVNLKATDLLVGEILSLQNQGGKGGAYINSPAEERNTYSATARTITASVACQNGDGTAGRSRVVVEYITHDGAIAATVAAT